MKRCLALILVLAISLACTANAFAIETVDAVMGPNNEVDQSEEEVIARYYSYCPYGHPQNYNVEVGRYNYNYTFAVFFSEVALHYVHGLAQAYFPDEVDDDAANALIEYIKEKRIADHSFLSKNKLWATEMKFAASAVQYENIYKVVTNFYADSAKTDYVGTITYYIEYFY